FIPDKIEWCDLQDITASFNYYTSGGYYYYSGFFYYTTFQTNGDTNRWVDLNTSNTSATANNWVIQRANVQYYTAAGTSARNWNKTANTTLYAKWTANTYTVSFEQQSGSGGTSSVTATYGQAMPSATMPTRTGYTFVGYYTQVGTGGTQYYTAAGKSARNWDIADNTTLYARWTANTYTITFNTNSATSSSFPESVTVTYGAGSYNDMSGSSISRTGYTFNGWYTSTSGGTQVYGSDNICVKGTSYWNSSTNWCYAGNVTVYARWTANTYTVTLNQQSGSGGTSSVTATYDSAMPSATMPTRRGYTFGGYYTSTGGSGTQYYTAEGESARNWDKTAATTLYAKWTINTYSVTIMPSNGKNGQNLVNLDTIDHDWTSNGNNMALSYKASTGVYTLTPSSSSDPYATAVTTAYLSSGTTYYMYYTLTNSSGASVADSSMQIFYAINGGYNETQSVRNNSNGYNSFTVPTTGTYNFRFDNDYGDQPLLVSKFFITTMSSTNNYSFSYTYGKTVQLGIPSRVGYTFSGWDISGNNYSVNSNNVLTIGSSNGNLIAKWTANTFTIAYNKNFSVANSVSAANWGSTANSSLTYDATGTLASNGYARNGYTFVGWATSSSATNPSFGQSLTAAQTNALYPGSNGGTTTLYAVWTKKSFTVTYDANGGSVSSDSSSASHGSTITLPTPTRTGHTFSGWVETADLLGDGSTFVRVFYHDNQGGSQLFGSLAECQSTNSQYKYSILSDLSKFMASGKYTFLLQYEYASGYNYWSQTSNPLEEFVTQTTAGTGTASGYTAISITSSTNYWGGLTRQNSDASEFSPTYLSGSVGHSNWYYAIGAKSSYGAGIPTGDGFKVKGSNSTSYGVSLWVKVDSASSLVGLAKMSQLLGGSTYYIRSSDTTLTATWSINSYELTVNYKNFVGNTATNITVDGGTGFAVNSSTKVTKQYSTTASTVLIATGKAYYVI
ncbi:MAG: InlB B-repeat-containing protein, partial [Christensenellales bacterium]